MKKVSWTTPGAGANRATAIAVGILAAGGAAALRLLLRPWLHDEATFTPNFLALFTAVYLAGGLAGLVTIFLGGLATYLFFSDPLTSLAGSPANLLSLGLFWVVSGLVLASLISLRRSIRELAAREHALAIARHQERLLSREMGHRIKNLLMVVQGLVDQTLKTSTNLPNAQQSIDARLRALAAAQELLLGPMERVRLDRVAEAALAPFGDDRIQLALGSEAEIDGSSARGAVLGLHELATNALKYGALTRPEGRVRVTTTDDAGGGIRMIWKESGGPPVQAPKRRGFGSRLISGALASSGGDVQLSYAREGVECVFHLRSAAGHPA